jgi:D-3-phosphoglycerate dehydrogenase
MSRPVAVVTLQQFCETDPQPIQVLEEAGFEVRRNRLGRRPTREELPEMLRGADAALAGVEPYDAALLEALPALRCISRVGVGVEAIDLAAARRRGIAIYTTPDEVAEPVAQMTVAMLLALARNLPQHHADAKAGAWTKRTGALLSEWTVGLVGFGRIGQAVERLLRAFGPRLLIADPAVAPSALPPSAALRTLPELLAESDVVSLHAARPADAGPLLGAAEFALMKPGSRLINTARGHLIDEAALLQALHSGRLAGAALDVYATEPYRGPLAALPQVLCTPHVATLTTASRAAMERRCAEQVVAHFARAAHGAAA